MAVDPKDVLNVTTPAGFPRVWTRGDDRAADLIGSSWRRRTDGWIADVDYSTGSNAGAGVHLVAKEGEETAGLDVPVRILMKAFDRMRREACRRCHRSAWRFDEGPGHYRYVRHGCAAARREWIAGQRGQFAYRCKQAVKLGWWAHPLAKVLRRRSRQLLPLETRQKLALTPLPRASRDAVKNGSWLVGAIYAMSANGLFPATIAQEVGIQATDVELVLAWADAVARRAADRTFRWRRR